MRGFNVLHGTDGKYEIAQSSKFDDENLFHVLNILSIYYKRGMSSLGDFTTASAADSSALSDSR